VGDGRWSCRNARGYETAVRFRSKLTHVAPVWFQLRGTADAPEITGRQVRVALWYSAQKVANREGFRGCGECRIRKWAPCSTSGPSDYRAEESNNLKGKVKVQLVGLPWAADGCPWVLKLRTMLPFYHK
jgi:hypothetical protein